MFKNIIITADDLGSDPNINRGIIESYKSGVLCSTALLMNALHTDEGIQLAKENPGLETGIHLSIVEGISLRGEKSTITDEISYFGDYSLTRNWKVFIKKYITGKINFGELEEELELQIVKFLRHFPEIPFLNGTQHMHIMPGVWQIVLKLAVKYHIKAIRTPSMEWPNSLWLNKRFPFMIPFQVLGQYAKHTANAKGIKTPDRVLGMQFSGNISKPVLLSILRNLPENKTSEIVMHPGYESSMLRENLPWGYSTFDWESEREALLSNEIKSFIESSKIRLSKFSEL
jgi:chitin disaccharide deacetylase